MYSNIRKTKTHKTIEIFFKFFVVFSPGDTVRLRCTFLAMVNNLKFTNINSGRNKVVKIIKNTVEDITKPFSEII